MDAGLGITLLLLAFGCTLYSVYASLAGVKQDSDALITSARNAAVVVWPLLTAASILLISLLLKSDFQVQYVWSASERSMPTYLKITAMWGGQAGSLLLWAWMMSTFTAGAMLRNWEREYHLMPYVIAFSMGTLGFFLLLVVFWENPFARFWQTPSGQVTAAMFRPSDILYQISAGFNRIAEIPNMPPVVGIIFEGAIPLAMPAGSVAVFPPDGQGLNPLLRHIGMIIHPPMLYIGYVGFVIPFAFGMAALVRGEIGTSWIYVTRRWTLVAWLFLGLGLILGGRWAYDVLGWGGYWGWDPVENAALMPWLTGTAFLHSVMIQEKRGMMRRWNMVLVISTYMLVILGTFATRSGIVSSVHSFAQSAIGPLFLTYLTVSLLGAIWLLIKRWDSLAADHPFESLLSREVFFLVNNVLFVGVTIGIGIYTYWAVFTELLSGFIPGIEKQSVGADRFEAMTSPFFLAIVLLMGVAPLVAWKRASAKRLGKAMLFPVGIAIIATILIYVFYQPLPLALLGYGVIIMSGAVNLMEFHRAASARVRAHGENYLQALQRTIARNRRRYGGYMVHLGVVMMGIGMLSSNVFQLETQRPVAAGETITLGDYVLEYNTLERFRTSEGLSITQAQTVVYRNGKEVARLVPRLETYPSGQPMSIPGLYSTAWGDDYYVLLVAWEQLDLSSATFKIYHNPLINWVWLGGLVFSIGSAVAVWPDYAADRKLASRRVRQAVPVAGK